MMFAVVISVIMIIVSCIAVYETYVCLVLIGIEYAKPTRLNKLTIKNLRVRVVGNRGSLVIQLKTKYNFSWNNHNISYPGDDEGYQKMAEAEAEKIIQRAESWLATPPRIHEVIATYEVTK